MSKTLKELWEKENSSKLVISGRQEPTIYAFSTNTVPNYLKVGDTYRSLSTRLEEWKKHYSNLKEEFKDSAMVSDDSYFRDYAVHDYLKKDLKKHQLKQGELRLPYFSNEFFKNTSPEDLRKAIKDIKDNYQKNTTKYQFYSVEDRLPKTHKYSRTVKLVLRDEQNQAVEKFKMALKKKRTNLLLYAVMRFGKSVVALRCAQEMKAKVILIVSAKADVGEEWKETVQSIIGFEKFEFLTANDLLKNNDAIKNVIKNGGAATVFLTLQDLDGNQIKNKHKELFGKIIDLVIIDETHFGAWAKSYGEILRNAQQVKDVKDNREGTDEGVNPDEAEKILKRIKTRIKLHLSGTPYRILLEKKFTDEDIIGYYQLSDIEDAKKKWDETHFEDVENSTINVNTGKPYQEWDNPYYGFPQMIRFAFNPNESSIKKLNELRKSNYSTSLSDLFMPMSIKKDGNGLHKEFKHNKEVLDLFKAIDGSKEDKNILSFLNDERIKKGNMCRHIVFVLPYRASCDALENLINNHSKEFFNIRDYKIINISGVDNNKQYKTIDSIKTEIRDCEKKNKKTITLTVNRMLTGVTVEEWDSMVFLKSLSSPQEYDQAIFRIQNQYVLKYKNKNGDIIKKDMKPQTLLVDFEPTRMFRIQENKSQIYNWYEDKNGNAKLKQRIEKDLSISPIIYFNIDKIQRVTATDLMKYISDYSNKISIIDELRTISIDLNIYNNPEIKKVIDIQSPFGSRNGLELNKKAYEGEKSELIIQTLSEPADKEQSEKTENNVSDIKESLIRQKIQTYYFKVLFYSFLADDVIYNLTDIINTIDKPLNKQMANNIGIDKRTLILIKRIMDPFLLSQLEYKIQNINELSRDNSITPEERMQTAIQKFNRLSESEIITPNSICEQMVKNLGRNITSGKILDIASKAGEFAISLYKALKKYNVKESIIKNSIYSIPTSPIAYEFTKKVYKTLNLNTNNIARYFTAYDIIKKNSKITKSILCQNDFFSRIRFDEKTIKKGGSKMKFSVIVGNPPYQENKKNNAKIYPSFYLNAISMSDNVAMIFPSAWQEPKNANGLQKLNKKEIKEDRQIVLINNKHNAFAGIAGAEWTNIVIWKKGYDNKLNGKQRILSDGKDEKIEKLIYDVKDLAKPKELKDIASLVATNRPFESVSSITSSTKPYGLRTDAAKNWAKYNLEPMNNEQKDKDDIKYFSGPKCIKYLPKNYKLPKNPITKTKFKVFIPNTWGNLSKNYIGGAYADIIIAKPYEICSETYIESGAFDNIETARKHAKYLMTRFCRALLFVNKHSILCSKAWGAVPLQDYSEKWWNKDIGEIDEELFKKYNIPNHLKEYVYKNIQKRTEENIINFK